MSDKEPEVLCCCDTEKETETFFKKKNFVYICKDVSIIWVEKNIRKDN